MLSSFKQSGGAKHREKRPNQIPPPLTLHNPGLTIMRIVGEQNKARQGPFTPHDPTAGVRCLLHCNRPRSTHRSHSR